MAQQPRALRRTEREAEVVKARLALQLHVHVRVRVCAARCDRGESEAAPLPQVLQAKRGGGTRCGNRRRAAPQVDGF